MARDILGPFEYEILQTLLQRPRDAYGASILERLEERLNRSVNVGSLYTTLERLERKGFASSWWGEATAERGGRRKRYYKIEASGSEAVRRTEAAFQGLEGGALTPQGA